jgi:hypothetical protein
VEIDVQEVLKEMRETIGMMAQENALLKIQIQKLTANDTGS